MKRFLAILLCLATLLVGFVACANGEEEEDKGATIDIYMDETFGLIETVEKAAQLYMLTAHMPHVNTILDPELKAVADAFGLDYRKDFLNL